MDHTILLITDDEHIEHVVREASQTLAARLECAPELRQWGNGSNGAPPDVVLCDYVTFDAVRQRWPRVCSVLYSEPSDGERAIEAIKRGALDLLIKPLSRPVVAKALEDALRIGCDVDLPAVLEDHDTKRPVQRIIGQSPAMKELYKLIGLIAPRDINVLITGESGTGKELVARAILQHSPRRDQPFLAVNCAAIPETLLESELFGHEKGAFTGADLRRLGKFEQCHDGTLFLDEIGDIPLATQAKLLRVLQDSSFQRLGGTQTIACDVRIITATHQPLEELIARRRFRQDLYYRLKVASIHVPALREREVDAVLLAHHFVNTYNRKFGTMIQRMAPDTLPLLLRHPWPGNVRELENAIKAALVVARGAVLRPEFLPEGIRQLPPAGTAHAAPDVKRPPPQAHAEPRSGTAALRSAVEQLLVGPQLAGSLHREALNLMERAVLQTAVERTSGNMAAAARLLGISRTTLRVKMDKLNLAAVTVVPHAPASPAANGAH